MRTKYACRILHSCIFGFLMFGAASCGTEKKESGFKNLKEFSDLRGVALKMKNISIADVDFKDKYDALLKSDFDTLTQWPAKDKLPPNFNPQEILNMGKDPGLGVRTLHKQGINGNGVRVAIIDQPLLLSHEEYKNQIAAYVPIDCQGVEPQMHGAAVSSLMVGKDCGTAPGASLYFYAEPSWKKDYNQRTTALKQIIEFNKTKSPAERIKVVSVSMGFNSDFKNLDSWKNMLEQARKSGLIVIHCDGEIFGVGCPLYKDVNDPANYSICYFAKEGRRNLPPDLIHVPIDNRTVASFSGDKDYAFFAKGGLSWGSPYLAGVIAMGFQLNPDLSESQVFKFLRETGTPFQKGVIVNPGRFVEKIKDMK